MYISEDGWLIIHESGQIVAGIPAKEVARTAYRLKVLGVPHYMASLVVPLTERQIDFIRTNTTVVLLSVASAMEVYY